MSEQHLEIVEQAVDAFNRQDAGSLGELVTADCEWSPGFVRAVEGVVYRGREGIATYLGEVHAPWEELRMHVDELRDLGDRVLLHGRAEGLGRGSGVEVDTSQWVIFEFRGEQISRVLTYLDRREGLRAAGLTE